MVCKTETTIILWGIGQAEASRTIQKYIQYNHIVEKMHGREAV
jgi:hypothetical protein